MADLKQFLELFNPLPGNHYIQVTTEVDETTKALYELLNAKDGEFRIAMYQDDDPKDVVEEYPLAKVQHIKNFVHPFRALPRDNDIVIFKDIFHLHHDQDRLLKTAYTTLANTAEIVIMQEKGTMDIDAMLEMLDRYEFRAPNYIEVLPGYDLVMAKKMHMWGNGL
jgi:predicted nicotinamide N-methyase